MRGLALTVLLVSLLPAPAHAEQGWEQFDEEDGIKLWKKEVEGSDFVAFRGRGPIEGNIKRVASVIRDAARDVEWMANCVDARTIRYTSALSAIVYNRTGSPAFFIDDRDIVLKTKTTVHPDKKLIVVTFDKTEDKLLPPLDGVVRMPVLNGHWKIRQIDVDTTEVEYQVQADPGGALPAWLVNLVSKKLPLETLVGLRKQVQNAKGYDQHEMILGVAIDWGPFEMPKETVAKDTPVLQPADGSDARVKN